MELHLAKALDFELSPADFLEILLADDELVNYALEINEVASARFIQNLWNQKKVEYGPLEGLSQGKIIQLANDGDHRAQYCLALKCEDDNDEDGANNWYRLAAENGNILCAYEYGSSLTSLTDQMHWFKVAAVKGHVEAQRSLATCYQELGRFATAKIWFKLALLALESLLQKSTDTEESEGLNEFKSTVLNDLGALHWEQDEKELAIEYWESAAQLGNQDAAENLESFRN
jgi:TPR repeat protein